jgi:RNA polymerase sigma-70 factor (ECF subfamily)
MVYPGVPLDFEPTGSTSPDLLGRVKGGDAEAWRRLLDLYGRRVYGWCRRAGLQDAEAADVAQEVFATVAARIDEFDRRQTGGFRAWLRAVTRHKLGDWIRRHRRVPQAEGGTAAQQRLQEIAEPAESPELPDSLEEQLGDASQVAHRSLELVRAEFEPRTWQAFWLVVVEARTPADVAPELVMTVSAVYKAKSRVLCRLRQEFLIDDG